MKTAITRKNPFSCITAWFKRGGRIYYSKDSERKVFFYLTIILLIAGVLAKYNII